MPVLDQRFPVIRQPVADALDGDNQRRHQDAVAQAAHQRKGVGSVGGDVHRRIGLLDGLGFQADALGLVKLPVVVQFLFGPGPQGQVKALHESPVAFLDGNAIASVMVGIGTAPDAENGPPAGKHVQRRHLLGNAQG